MKNNFIDVILTNHHFTSKRETDTLSRIPVASEQVQLETYPGED